MATRAQLVDAAKDLNTVLDLSPPIDVRAGVDDLKEKIKEAAELLRDSDEIASATRAVVDAITGKVDSTDGDEAGDDDGETKVKAEKPAKVKAEKPAKVKAEKPAKVKAEKPAKSIGAFKPIRAGTRLHKLLEAADRGDTITEMVKVFKEGASEKDVAWWMRYTVRRNHGIDYVTNADGTYRLILPIGKSNLSDCVI